MVSQHHRLDLIFVTKEKTILLQNTCFFYLIPYRLLKNNNYYPQIQDQRANELKYKKYIYHV